MELRNEFPLLVLQYKEDHWYWKLLHWIIVIFTFGGNRRFLPGFTTTLGRMIGFSGQHSERIKNRSQNWENRVYVCLKHEREHLRQFLRYSVFGMFVLYLLFPFPIVFAYFRARFERAGYIQTLRGWFETDRTWAESDEALSWLVSQFTGPNYGWCWPFKKIVRGWFALELSKLQQGPE